MTQPPLAVDARGLVCQFRRGARHRYRTTTAVAGVDVTIPEGTVFGLLGPNGAGKTTTIHMLLGLVRPTEGSVLIFGEPVRHASTRQHVGYVPETFALPGYLSARRFLQLHAQLQGSMSSMGMAHEINRVLERVSLLDRADDTIDTFSKGMQQRLAIAQAILGSPRLVVFDEPTSALDPIGRRDVRDLIAELRGHGTTVILNSHLLAEVEQQCDEVLILDKGRVAGHLAVHADTAAAAKVAVRARIAGLSDPLVARLRLRAPNLIVHASQDVEVGGATDVSFAAAGEAGAAFVAEEVVAAGAQLLSLTVESASLEERFLDVIGGAARAVDPATAEVSA
jgi:ABC-2 type transport system ATP-binding protein